ncbi:MAG: transglutaminase domain-containing protein [Candidatus Aenigmatarchaeota archaeon]|nr:MAG: transglutaminase domain-containing protein [Candidatus Aenigmarchaeota archaeon]
MHGIKTLIPLLIFVLLIPLASAKLIENPEAVSYLHTSVMKDGSVFIQSKGPLARTTGLSVYLSIPQNSESQSSVLQGVEGPDSYEMQEDQWGNEMIRLFWDNPPLERNIDYSVSFDVEIQDKINPAPGKSFKATNMTKASLEMTEMAYNLVSDLNEIEKLFKLTEWVYYWVDYEHAYQNLPKNAEWVFENRKGICSSNSNLLISLLRELGFNAYYVIGYAYTEETPGTYWGPHGWVEVEYGGKSISLDPTWLESPIDGTHIKFANAPDSNYTERAEILGSQVKLVWTRNEPEINIIEMEDSERVDVQAEFIPEEVGSESYALLLARVSSLSASECILSYMQIQSCAIGEGYFLDILRDNQTLAFCNNDTLFWFMKTPKLKGSTIYTCPVSIYSAGTLKKPQLRARMLTKNVHVRMSTPKVLTPNQVFTVETTLENHGFSKKDLKTYLILDEEMQSKDLELDPGYQAKLTWTQRAPVTPGEVKLRFFSSSGDLLEHDLTVISKRHVKIEGISIPENMTLEDSLFLNVTVKGLEQTRAELQLKIEGETQTREFYIEKDETKNFIFPYTPESEGNKEISIILLSEDIYEDGMVGNLLVIGESGFWEQIVGWIGGFFAWLSSLFGF